jgi:hypothetical protein
LVEEIGLTPEEGVTGAVTFGRDPSSRGAQGPANT